MTAVICHSSRDGAPVRSLVQHLQAAGETVWLAQSLSGEDGWWARILDQIRSCTVFVVALSNHSLQSKRCQAEMGYASALGLPILAVQVGAVTSFRDHPLLSEQYVDYRNPDMTTGMVLVGALHERAAQRHELPDPLPDPPPIPCEYLQRFAVAIDSPEELSPGKQSTVLLELRRALQEEDEESVRDDIRRLLHALRRRSDVTDGIATEIDHLLGARPSATADSVCSDALGEANTIAAISAQDSVPGPEPKVTAVDPARVESSTVDAESSNTAGRGMRPPVPPQCPGIVSATVPHRPTPSAGQTHPATTSATAQARIATAPAETTAAPTIATESPATPDSPAAPPAAVWPPPPSDRPPAADHEDTIPPISGRWRRHSRPIVAAAAALVLAVVVAVVTTTLHGLPKPTPITPSAYGAQTVLPFPQPQPNVVGVAVDGGGDVYVGMQLARGNIESDTAEGSTGIVKLAAGSSTPTLLPFTLDSLPSGLAVDRAGDVYVTDGIGRKVLRFAAGSSTPTVLPFTYLYLPTGVAVDSAGNVYVADTDLNAVVKLAAGSSSQTVLPFKGFASPWAVAVDSTGDVYVTDIGGGNSKGTPIGRVIKLAAGSSTPTVLPFTGLNYPEGVTVDTAGTVYVTDRDNNRVLKLAAGSSTPTLLPFYGLNSPEGVAVDTADNVYVVDYARGRVVKLPAA